jgi:hypothetical protein
MAIPAVTWIASDMCAAPDPRICPQARIVVSFRVDRPSKPPLGTKQVSGALVEITSKIGQRALTYVAAVASQGYELSVGEFEAYVSTPAPEGRSAWGPGRHLEASGAGAPQSEGEPVLDWLARLGWLSRRDGRVTISPLGRAVLRAVEQGERQTTASPDVSLGLPEPFPYGPLLVRMADLRDALLVDRTFQLDQLLDVVLKTSVTRILIGADPTQEGERRRLAAALARPLGIDRPLFIGVSNELHDRFVIPPNGPVGFLAASRGSGGERVPVLGAIQAPAADAIRRAFEDVWARATPLVAEAGFSTREQPAFHARPMEMPPSTPVPDLPPPASRQGGLRDLPDVPDVSRERDTGLAEQLLGARGPEEPTVPGPLPPRRQAPAPPQPPPSLQPQRPPSPGQPAALGGRVVAPQAGAHPSPPPGSATGTPGPAPPPGERQPGQAAERLPGPPAGRDLGSLPDRRPGLGPGLGEEPPPVPAEHDRFAGGDQHAAAPPLRDRVLGREPGRAGREDERRPQSVLHTLRSLVSPSEPATAPGGTSGDGEAPGPTPPAPGLEPTVPIGNHAPRPPSQPPAPQGPHIGPDEHGVGAPPPWLPPSPWSPGGPPVNLPRQPTGGDVPTQTWRVDESDNGH